MPARGALPELLECLVDRADLEDRRRLAHRETGVFARVDGRQRFKVGDDRERLARFDHHVANVRRRHRLEPTFLQRLGHNLGNQVVGNVVQDLVVIALLHDLRRDFALSEPRHFAVRL